MASDGMSGQDKGAEADVSEEDTDKYVHHLGVGPLC